MLSSFNSTLSSQAYVLNLPIGHKISNVAKDEVEQKGYKWDQHNKRRRNTWVMIYCKFSTYQLNSYLSAAMGVSRSSDNHHRWFLGALLNCDFRWESILEEFGISCFICRKKPTKCLSKFQNEKGKKYLSSKNGN